MESKHIDSSPINSSSINPIVSEVKLSEAMSISTAKLALCHCQVPTFLVMGVGGKRKAYVHCPHKIPSANWKGGCNYFEWMDEYITKEKIEKCPILVTVRPSFWEILHYRNGNQKYNLSSPSPHSPGPSTSTVPHSESTPTKQFQSVEDKEITLFQTPLAANLTKEEAVLGSAIPNSVQQDNWSFASKSKFSKQTNGEDLITLIEIIEADLKYDNIDAKTLLRRFRCVKQLVLTLV